MQQSSSRKRVCGNIKVDLHIHTTASDGTWRPANLVKKVLTAGIELFAVTDHDTTDSLNEVALLAREHNLRFIKGVEVNTTYKGRNYHILGLGIEPESKELQALLKNNRELMEKVDDETIRYLEKRFPIVSFDEYKRYYNRPERGGWKALNYLIDKQLCSSYRDFFQLFRDWGNPFDRLVFPSPGEAVKVIYAAGGVPVLAHPGAQFYDRDYKSLIKYMVNEGIRGIECYHPENGEEITEYCIEICRSNDLLVTGGSDCHGEFVPSRSLGNPQITFSQLKLDGIDIY